MKRSSTALPRNCESRTSSPLELRSVKSGACLIGSADAGASSWFAIEAGVRLAAFDDEVLVEGLSEDDPPQPTATATTAARASAARPIRARNGVILIESSCRDVNSE